MTVEKRELGRTGLQVTTLGYRLRSEPVKDPPQRADTRRERVAIVLDDIVKLLG